MTAIETNHVTKTYGDKKVVNDVSFTIQKGEVFSILGVNGAGKSTLIKMLSCLVKLTSGKAFIFGYDVMKEAAQVKKLIAVSPQETAIAPNLTVYENLELMAGAHGFSKKDRERKLKEVMGTFLLIPFEKQRSKTLSGGWKRRLSIAMALISEPDILFLDEPTLGLDILARRELWKVIKGLKGRVTIILTTHYLEEAESLSDRICILKRGEVKALGTAKELIAQTSAQSFEDAFIDLVGEGSI
ncbi:ABC-2 type transport system ATP-binding protein [Bacillus thermophilus]|uniref:ABC-2 type transport system ATP-binding protein n=1 Tax=Siminovitchia thermophila TaxID=1245522 RepID=A0ABS2RBV9_9BACI|nr:ABC transporter ATP-binding protein [Siminovitchia thermophila]MBM7717142.1 ABC-2 type transport system ATP-binding protein [Siminovitchia thermophila]ONK23490.1 ABC transporter ATP-binding protein [Bacillus sp. VT-16-64]